MTWPQLVAWFQYAEVEPFGEYRADLRSGTVAAVIANTNRDPKKRPRPFTPSDFMPEFGKPQETGPRRKPLTDPEEWTKVIGMAKALGRARAGS